MLINKYTVEYAYQLV